jgi:hypothetical protein
MLDDGSVADMSGGVEEMPRLPFKRIDLGLAEGDASAPAAGITQPHPTLPEKVAAGSPGASTSARTVPLRSGSSAPVATPAPPSADKHRGASAIELRAKPETNSPSAAVPPVPAPSRSLRRLAIPLSAVSIVAALAFAATARWETWLGAAAVQTTDDATVRSDLAKAVQMGVQSRYLINNGRGCICAKRFLVAEPLLEAFTKAFVEQSKALPMGDPMQEGVKLGPLARADLRRNVDRQVQDAVKAGARVLTGGEIPDGPGNFYPPTVLIDLPREAAIAREEFFGPVAVIYPFRTEAEAVELANDTDFGLGASVWSRDSERANRLASHIEAGMVFINDIVHSDPRAPFGGVKASGIGRELGAPGVLELTSRKLVWQG